MRRRAGLAALVPCVLVLLLVLSCARAQAFPGDLDASFGVGGVALASLGDGGDAEATATASTADGGLVVAGSAVEAGGLDLALERLTAAGQLDPSFGTDGVVVDTTIGQTTSQANAVAVEPDGDILVAGSADTASCGAELMLALYSPTGQLVTSFHNGVGPAGTALVAVGDDCDAQANAIVLDGADVLVTGSAGEGANTQMFYAELSASTGAQVGTSRLFALGVGTDTVGNAIALDGADVVLAGTTEGADARELALAQVTPAGATVGGFGSGGTVTQAVGSSDAIANGVAVEPSGRIVVSGSVVQTQGTAALLAAFTAAGTLDSSFGSSGTTQLAIGAGGNAVASAIALTPEGGLAIAGQAAGTIDGQAANQPLVARLTATGALDPSFAPGSPEPGTVLLSCDADAGFTSAFVQSDGELVAAGNDGADGTHQAFLAARLLDTQSTAAGTGCGSDAGSGGAGGGGGGGSTPPTTTGATPPTTTTGTTPTPTPTPSCTSSIHSFGILQVQACFTTEGPLLIASGPIDADGIQIVPSPCTTVVFDTVSDTMRTACSQGGEGEVSVGLSGVPLYRGALNWTVPTQAGQSLGPLAAGAFADLEGFPIVGQVDFTAQAGGIAQVTVNASLPDPFDSVTGSATLQASLSHGLDLSSLQIAVDDLFLGPVEVKDVSVDYDAATDSWSGSADAALPPPLFYDVSASVGFTDGDFSYLSASVNNLNVALGSAVFLQEVGFGVQTNPLTFEGTIGLSLGPQIDGANAIGLDGQLVLEIPPGGWDIRLSGQASVVDVPLASAYVEIDSDGNAFFGGGIDFGNCDELCVQANASGWLDLSNDTFDAYASAKLGILSYTGLSGQIDVSSKALSGCASVQFILFNVSLGGAYVWGGGFHPLGDFSLGPSGASCDLSPYRPTAPTPVIGAGGGVPGLARPADERITGDASALTSDRLTVAPHTHGLVWAISGAGAAPAVTITGPGGIDLQTNADGAPAKSANALLLQDPATDTTYAILAGPKAGKWLITPQSTALTAIHAASVLPAPKVTAHVTGSGSHRVLSYTDTPLPGQSIRFIEGKGSFASQIGSTTQAKGAIRFIPAAGPGGRRAITAEVKEGMTVRKRIVVAHYTAPADTGPSRPTGLRIARHGDALQVRWHPAAGAAGYLVTFDGSDGTIDEQRTTKTHLTLAAVPAYAGAKLSVAGMTSFRRLGRAAIVRLPIPLAPRLHRRPSITDTAAVGDTVTCMTGSWRPQPARLVVEWLLGGRLIAHADHARLRLSAADRGHRLSCEVTARNAVGYAVATSQAVKVTARPARPGRRKPTGQTRGSKSRGHS
jgi:uncharacterized delta-60 repeat protein